jgi:hypothetical protein
MATLTKTPDEVVKDFAGGNGPDFRTTGAWKISKAELRTLLDEIVAAIDAAGSTGLVFATQAALFAYLTPGPNTEAIVRGDPVVANNGYYLKVGASGTGSWSYERALYDSDIAFLQAQINTNVVDIYRNQDAVGEGGFRRGLKVWAPQFAEVWLDKNNLILGGRHWDGRVEDLVKDQTEQIIAHPLYREMYIDKNGLFISGSLWPVSGSSALSSSGLPMALYDEVDSVTTRRTVYAHDPAARTYTKLSWDSAGNDTKEQVSNDLGIWTNIIGTAKVTRAIWVKRTDTLAPGITDLYIVPMLGESLSVGTANPASVVTPTPLNPGRGLSFANGPRPFQIEQVKTNIGVLDFNRIKDFANLREVLEFTKGETQVSRAVARYLTALPATVAVFAFTAGWGSANIADLSKPGGSIEGTAYELYLRCLAEVVYWARSRVLNPIVPAFMFEQSANDSTTSYASYDASLVALQANFETDAKAMTGQAGNIPLICAQPSFNGTGNIGIYTQPPFVFLDRAISTPTKFKCIGPDYFFNHSDHLHLASADYALQGSFYGRSLADLFNGVANQLPLYMLTAVRTVNNVLVTFNRSIQSVTARVSDPGNLGFTLIGDTNGRTISSAGTISGATCTVVLSGAPSAGSKLGLASFIGDDTGTGPTTWERSPICDLSTEVGYGNTTMRRHASIQQITIT